MKRVNLIVSIIVLSSTALGACNLSPGAAGLTGATEPPATLLPTTEPPIATETPTLVPVDLAGPPMQVSSFYTYVDGSVLAAVPGGPFTMGYNNFNDSKEHQVTLSDYWIYINEVTNQQYALCVTTGKCAAPDHTDNPDFDGYRFVNYPVVGVTYQDAADYCGFVHGRLPTEAEWEKAARGPDANLFPWGNGAPSCDLLNHNFCQGKALKVESYPKGVSYYGLFDMSGNVREWAADWYLPEYDATVTNDPLGPALGEKRSVRSSSFEDGGDYAFSAHRFALKPTEHLADLGFRCVVDDPTFFAPYCEGLVLYGADINGSPSGPPSNPVANDCVQSSLSGTQDGCGAGTSHLTIDPWPLPAGTTLDIPASAMCNGDRPTATCTGTGTASITPQVCPVTPGASDIPSCSPGYGSPIDDGSGNVICKGQGPGKECMPGFNYDPLLQCCTAVNPNPNQYGLCVGFDHASPMQCYNDPKDPIQPHLVTYDVAPPAACGDNSGCDPVTDPTCQPTNGCTPQQCSIYQHWDPIKCVCQSN